VGIVKRRVLQGLWRRLVGVGVIGPGLLGAPTLRFAPSRTPKNAPRNGHLAEMNLTIWQMYRLWARGTVAQEVGDEFFPFASLSVPGLLILLAALFPFPLLRWRGLRFAPVPMP
jgi:hypothetical protein